MVSINDPAVAASLASDRLHLVLLPTEACNFRCVYCFEEFKHGRMEPWVVRGVKRLLGACAPDLHELSLSWFGGEPLLALDVIEDVMTCVGALRRRHPRLRLHSDVTTNGHLLTPARFERLLGLGVTAYQISFDGPRRWHDRKRVLAGGGPTFDRIWSNLGAMRRVAQDFLVLVRLHADAENRASLPGFLEEYAREFANDGRFQLFLRPLSRFGGPNDAALPVLGRRAGEETVRDLRDRAARRGIAQYNIEHMGSMCYAARGNSCVIRADGRLNKCSLAPEDPANQIGRLHEDGTLDIDRARFLPWLRGLFEEGDGARRCPKRGLTGGRTFPVAPPRPLRASGAAAGPVAMPAAGRRPAAAGSVRGRQGNNPMS